jgi:hypothetical protein
MTAKQRAARAKFKLAVIEAKRLRKKNPSLTQAQALRQAFAISYSKKRAGKKIGKHTLTNKKPSEQDIAEKITTVKNKVNELDTAQNEHMSIGAMKSKAMRSLQRKFGILAAKKLIKRKKSEAKKLQKEMTKVRQQLKKLSSL